MKEIWRPIPGREDYAVSNRARIRRATPGISTYPGRLIKIQKQKSGHRRVVIRHNGKYVLVLVHRAVALAFIGPPPTPRHQVAHRKGDPSKNRPKDIRWSLPVDNCKDTKKHGRLPMGSKHGGAKLNEGEVLKIRSLRAKGALKTVLARRFNVSTASISLICSGATWKHVPIKKNKIMYCKGEDMPAAKLIERQIKEIRKASARGATQIFLAEKYGVTDVTIARIVHRRAWKHVP